MTTPQTDPDSLTPDEMLCIKLLTDYCLLTQQEDLDALMFGEEFEVAGVNIRFIYEPSLQPAVMGVWCDFAEVPAGKQEELYLTALQLNAIVYNGVAPVMALCPETGLVVCCAKFEIKGLTAPDLIVKIQLLVESAKQWQSDL